MLPEWMEKQEDYIPSNDHSRFVVDSIKSIGEAMSRIKIQKGHEKGRTLPPLFKLILMFAGILFVSISQNRIPVMAYAAFLLLYLCTWPAEDIWNILKAGLMASFLAFLILLPAMILNSGLIWNEFFIVLKVFLSIITVSIFNHTTQWNHVTKALRQLHIPGVFVFTLDITLKYIVLLGKLTTDLLTSLQLRSVGKNNKKYNSIGGVMGITFVRGAQMNRQMYEAMLCRGFTDDYEGLKVKEERRNNDESDRVI